MAGDDWRYNAGTGAGQEGVADGEGLNNIGLLITTFGEFTKTSATTFTLDDGSGVTVKCEVPSGVTLEDTWTHARVTGISSCEKPATEILRLLRVRDLNDIEPY